MTSSIAKSCMSALSPHLMALIALDMTRIGLRVNLAADFVSLVNMMMLIFLGFMFPDYFIECWIAVIHVRYNL